MCGPGPLCRDSTAGLPFGECDFARRQPRCSRSLSGISDWESRGGPAPLSYSRAHTDIPDLANKKAAFVRRRDTWCDEIFSLSARAACLSSPSSSNTLPSTLYSSSTERLFGILLFPAFGFQHALKVCLSCLNVLVRYGTMRVRCDGEIRSQRYSAVGKWG